MSDKINITVLQDDESTKPIEIFMSYGLLNQLCNIIGSPERAVALDFDPELSAQVITALLIPRVPSGQAKMTGEELDKYQLPGMTMSESEKLIDWAKEHVIDFFTRRSAAALELMKGERLTKLQEIQKATVSLQTGMSPSASLTQ